jgi:S1-C subfamily serine protease
MPRPVLLSFVLFFSLLVSRAVGQTSADIVAKAEESLLKIEVENVGQGSGFVVDESGIAITNVHVMAGAQDGRAIATFPNGTKCEITGSYLIDEGRDIAVIQLKLDGLPTLPMSENLPRKGEEVLALGSPMGLSFTATRGIVSAIRSEEEMKNDLNDPSIRGTWVQVDAPLSPGNSGGPLINSKGELVAMSTRASFGQAQNLNFGISVVDIREAVDKAKSKSLLSLATGLGKIDMEESKPKSGVIIKRTPIPRPAILDYIEKGKEEFTSLTKSLRREVTTEKELLKQMRLGRVDYSISEEMMRDTRGRFYFNDETVKVSTIRTQEERVRELDKVLQKIGKGQSDETLFSLLWQYGPTVNVRNKGSIGFLYKAVVVMPVTSNDIVIQHNEAAYLLWVKDASGLSPGTPLPPLPVYVAGARTIEVPERGSIAVTILNSMLETELKAAIFPTGDSGQVAAEPLDQTKQIVESSEQFRKWRDKTGQFEIEATLVTKDDSKVVLKRRDGSLITVPTSKLSGEDRKFLGVQ